jgi:hypothetical protein
MKTFQPHSAVSALAAIAGLAQGQGLPPGATVIERERPEVDAVSRDVGAFELGAVLAFGSERDDNVFAERDGTRADTALWVQPAFDLASNWTRHALSLAGDFKTVRYHEYDSEDYDDSGVSLRTRLDIRDLSALSLDLDRREGAETRESPDDRGADRRTQFNTELARLAYSNRRTRLRLDLETEWARLDFKDAFRSSDASTINNDDRDRRETLARARVGYQVATDYGLFAQAVVNDRSYDQVLDDDGFDRSSSGWELVLGVALDRSDIVFGDFFAGYRKQEFADPRFEDVEAPTFGAELTWNVTGLTTLSALAERVLEDTTIVGVSGIQSTRLRLGSDHELRRNLIVSVAIENEEEDFQGTDQTDDIRRLNLTVRYLMNRRLHLVGGYRNERRSSTAAAPLAFEYSKDVYFVQLQGHL